MAIPVGAGAGGGGKNKKPKFPTLPTTKFDGNPNPAGNRIGGVGDVPKLPTPETVVGAQTKGGDFRTTAPGAGSQPIR